MLHAEAAEVQEVIQRVDILTAVLDLAVKQDSKENPAMASHVIQVTSENYHKEVIESKTPVVLDAYMDGCHPCHDMEPIVAELSNEMVGKVKFVKLNAGIEPVGRDLKIKAFPTFLFYKNGKIVDRHVGSMDKSQFSMQINKSFY